MISVPAQIKYFQELSNTYKRESNLLSMSALTLSPINPHIVANINCWPFSKYALHYSTCVYSHINPSNHPQFVETKPSLQNPTQMPLFMIFFFPINQQDIYTQFSKKTRFFRLGDPIAFCSFLGNCHCILFIQICFLASRTINSKEGTGFYNRFLHISCT